MHKAIAFWSGIARALVFSSSKLSGHSALPYELREYDQRGDRIAELLKELSTLTSRTAA